MSWQEEMSKEEENKLVRRGGCIATVLLIVGICCCGNIFLDYTPQGRNLIGWYFMEEFTNGILSGEGLFANFAQKSCDLARESPRPSDYQEKQNLLEQRYRTSLRMYWKVWIRMRKDGGDISKHEPPDQLPPDLTASKSRYCR